jgi:uncharacterized protein YxjI
VEELKRLIDMYNSVVDQLTELQEIRRKINESVTFEIEHNDGTIYETIKHMTIHKDKIEKLIKTYLVLSEDYKYLEDKIKEIPVIWN